MPIPTPGDHACGGKPEAIYPPPPHQIRVTQETAGGNVHNHQTQIA